MDLIAIAKACQSAAYEYATLSTAQKNQALEALATILEAHKDEIYAINALDVKNAQERGLNEALVDRLTLTRPALLRW